MAWVRSFVASCAGVLAALLVLAPPTPAQAEYRLCNRTGYVLDAALAIESEDAAATQGWFRVLPGACEPVLSGGISGERFFIHTRAPSFYGGRPEAAEISRMFCVLSDDFLLAGARRCANGRGELASFSEVVAEGASPATHTVLTDGSARSLEEARKMAIQRLLAIAGYDPGPADGNFGAKTLAALAAFGKARGLRDTGIAGGALFAALIEAAEQAASATGATGQVPAK